MQLQGIKGIHWTQTFPLTGIEVTIGREPGNTIVCDGDSRVSRKHARLVPSGLTYTVEDLGSSNGTFVNGMQISGPTLLKAGDEIQIGGQIYRLEEGAQTVVPPPVAAPPRPKEVSRGEQAQRIYGGPPGSSMPGCALPQFNLPDVDGCLRLLMMFFIACVVIGIIGGLLLLLGTGFRALTHGGSPGGASGGASTSSTTGGSNGSTSGGGGSGSSGGGEQSIEPGIHITAVRVAGSRIQVSWDNGTSGPVHKIWAKVTTLDASGTVLAKSDEIVIFDGKPVEAGATHADAGSEGFNAPVGGSPISATVVVTRSE